MVTPARFPGLERFGAGHPAADDRDAVSAAAGYRVPEGSELYRGYVIAPFGGIAYPVVFHHRNFDGAGDARRGEAPTVEAAKREIDERIDEGFDGGAA